MVDFGTALLISGMILGNSLLTVLTWFYILNKTQENLMDVLNQLKDVIDTVKR